MLITGKSSSNNEFSQCFVRIIVSSFARREINTFLFTVKKAWVLLSFSDCCPFFRKIQNVSGETSSLKTLTKCWCNLETIPGIGNIFLSLDVRFKKLLSDPDCCCHSWITLFRVVHPFHYCHLRVWCSQVTVSTHVWPIELPGCYCYSPKSIHCVSKICYKCLSHKQLEEIPLWLGLKDELIRIWVWTHALVNRLSGRPTALR